MILKWQLVVLCLQLEEINVCLTFEMFICVFCVRYVFYIRYFGWGATQDDCKKKVGLKKRENYTSFIKQTNGY